MCVCVCVCGGGGGGGGADRRTLGVGVERHYSEIADEFKRQGCLFSNLLPLDVCCSVQLLLLQCRAASQLSANKPLDLGGTHFNTGLLCNHSLTPGCASPTELGVQVRYYD